MKQITVKLDDDTVAFITQIEARAQEAARAALAPFEKDKALILNFFIHRNKLEGQWRHGLVSKGEDPTTLIRADVAVAPEPSHAE